jgi:glycosyltransferase involved in cell wall biosynthesis
MSSYTYCDSDSCNQNKTPKVSVIVPTYNRERLVCEAIESILIQTYPNYEIIVVDDGSTDNTAEVLGKYKTKICYIQQENKGPGDARNRGIAEASGKYIAFLDSDDMWFDFKLELQVAVMEKLTDVGFLFSDFCILKDAGKDIHYGLRTWHKQIKPWNEIFSKSTRYSSLNTKMAIPENDFDIFLGNLYYPLMFDPYVWPSGAVVRHECIDDTMKFAEGVFLYEDWEFFAKLSSKYNAVFMDIETFYNRGHSYDVRLTQCSKIKKAENRLRLIERVWKQDVSFSKKFANEIAGIEGEQLLILSKENLIDFKPKVARRFISQLDQLGLGQPKYKLLVLKIFAYLPGGSILLKMILGLRRLLY